MRHLLAYIILLLIPLNLASQENDTIPEKPAGQIAVPEVAADTIPHGPPQGAIPKRPGVDSLIKRTTRIWTLSADYTAEVPVNLDTAFFLFHRYRITDKFSEFNAYPGNYGLPLYQINFFDRDWNPDRYLYSYYLPFMYTPAKTRFINTHVPFTEMVWTNGGSRSKSEQTFRIRHSQNVNRKLNFGLIYDIVYALGQYDYQKASDKNFILHGSYNSNQYTAYFSTGINNHESNENGGIEGKEYLSRYPPEDVPVRLNELDKAKSTLKNRYLLLVQRYSPGGKRDTVTGELIKAGPVTFSQISTYEWSKRRYFDSYPVSAFYDTIMISRTATNDSVYQSLLSNTLRADIAAGSSGRFRIGAGAGVRSEIRGYGQVMPGDSLTRQDTVASHNSSLVITAKVFNNIGEKFGWWASGDLWFQGYRAGDFIADGRIYKDFGTKKKGMITWDATATIASYTPSFWYTSWGSNNISWQFNPAKEFRLTAGSSLSWPGRNMNLRFNYAIIDNYIYMGNDAKPAQNEGGLSVISITAAKDLVFWKLHWYNTVLIQQSTNSDVLSLPLAAARSAFFFDHMFSFRSTGGELYVELGAEAMIHTPYRAMNYMPPTGRFFSQSDTETGNYPFVNVFINLKVKRTRIFIMLDHLNSGLTGYEYFLLPSYPLNVRMIRYGLAWTFYD